MNYEINDAFDLVIPSGRMEGEGIDVITNYGVSYPYVFQLNPLKKWEMGLLDLSVPGRGREALEDQLWFKVAITNEGSYVNGKFESMLDEFKVMPNIQKIIIPSDIVEKDDTVLIYQYFKSYINKLEFGYASARGGTMADRTYNCPFDVELIKGKVNFVFREELKETMNITLAESGKFNRAIGPQCNIVRIQMSIPLSFMLGVNNFGDRHHESTIFNTSNFANGGVSVKRNVTMWHSVTPEDSFDLTLYKLEVNKDIKDSRLKCENRLQAHIYPQTSFNIECELLEDNFVGGIAERSRTLRHVTFSDSSNKSHTQIFESKNVLYMPMEQLVFQTISIKLMNEKGNVINLINPSSVNNYVGQTLLTVRIRPSLRRE